MNSRHASQRIAECIQTPLSGEWGEEAEKGDADAVRVIRTTNFTNIGKIDYSVGVVWRKVPEKLIRQKLLVPGDIIIEKSGGSPIQPVGRVVFFENDEGPFLCNNFTAVIRSRNAEHIFPRYLFYALFFKHKNGQTLKFQNKTTGIINLQLAKYIASEQLPLPPIEVQRKIAAVLDKAQELIDLRKAQLEKMDEFLRSVFLDMFGDPVTNPKGLDAEYLCNVAESRLGKMRDEKQISGNHLMPYLGNSNVRWFAFDLSNLQVMDFESDERNKYSRQQGDLLVCEGGEVGRCAIWNDNKAECYFQKALHRIRVHKNRLYPEYLQYVFWHFAHNGDFNSYASQATISHLTGEKLKTIKLLVPPLPLQTRFAEIVETTEAQKALMQQSLDEMENNFNSLMQRAFRGELF